MNRKPALSLIRLCLFGGCTLALISPAGAAPPRVLEQGKLPDDFRLKAPRDLNDKHHPWTPPASLTAWEAQKDLLREQLLVAEGLWPMPLTAPLKPVIHGKIERDDYTIEKVFVASLPGHYVSGNLYRPKKIKGKIPGVLFAHGHWKEGRMYEIGAEQAQKEQIDKGGEKFLAGAQYPLQALPVSLARMGCTVFIYDTIGNADSKKVSHTEPFKDTDSTLRLQSSMGLQTINSIRALDFLLSLPEVDANRIGVTGASGGGTQTFMLCALDPRPSVAFPAVMVSTAMQGGCVCENCCYLRIGTNNVAITATFAPKPLAMTGANDWTLEIESKGLPELKRIYELYGKPELVSAKCLPQFDHNYNQVSREIMYGWFNQHLKLGLTEPMAERDFVPVPPKELSVYDAAHPLPADALDGPQLKAQLTRVSEAQFAALLPKDAATLAKYQRVVGAAARVMLDKGVPATSDVGPASSMMESQHAGYKMYRVSASRRGAGEQIPIVALVPDRFTGKGVLWFDGAGKRHLFDAEGRPTAAVQTMLNAGLGVISADLFQTGEFLEDDTQPVSKPKVNESYAGYTFGYNKPLLAQRVHDVLTVIGGVKRYPDFTSLQLIGTGEAGTWVLLARALAGDTVERCVVDLQGFGFSKVTAADDPRMLPGGLKYGGIGGLAALAAPAELTIFGTRDVPANELAALESVYAASKGNVNLSMDPLTPEAVAAAFVK